jgi:hypothetical protein
VGNDTGSALRASAVERYKRKRKVRTPGNASGRALCRSHGLLRRQRLVLCASMGRHWYATGRLHHLKLCAVLHCVAFGLPAEPEVWQDHSV